MPLWWSPRARAPVSGYALEGHVADAGVRCGTGLGYGYCSLDGRVLLVSRYGGAGGYHGYTNCPRISNGTELGYACARLGGIRATPTVAARCSTRRYTRWDEIGTQNWTRDTQNVNCGRPVPLLIQGQNVGIRVQPVCHSGTRDGMYPYANWPSDRSTFTHMSAVARWTMHARLPVQNWPRDTTWNWLHIGVRF